MYSLNCNYYGRKFNSLNELILDIINSGMDPNYEITKDGKLTGEKVVDFLVF
jgi:hypothetical protein